MPIGKQAVNKIQPQFQHRAVGDTGRRPSTLRLASRYHRPVLRLALTNYDGLEPIQLVMERATRRGIKQRATAPAG